MKKEAIFINCPFDADYRPLLNVLLFSIRFYNLKPLISSLDSNTTQNRLSKIERMVNSSQYSIHDLSRMKSTEVGEYYRMNMPFELGMDYGMCGKQKRFLIFESEPHSIAPALSDINGWDISYHESDAQKLLEQFRKWIVVNDPNLDEKMKGTSSEDLWFFYNDFQITLDKFKEEYHFKDSEISIKEYLEQIDKYFSHKKKTSALFFFL